MGLKYKDPVTGQYVRYNFPLIQGDKGEKGEPGTGIHVGAQAPTDPHINLWFDPSDGANVTQDMLDKKVDKSQVTEMPGANTIPVRNVDGNMTTGHALGFKGADFEIPLIMTNQGHLKAGLNNVWDSTNFPFTNGKFTPYWSGASATMTRQYGEYVRMGPLVYIYLEIESTEWLNHGHDLIIGGLPFSSTQQTPVTIDMVKGIIEASELDNPHIYGMTSGTKLGIYKRGVNGQWWSTVKTQTDVHPHLVLRAAFVYRIA